MPLCKVCGSHPVVKTSDHLFLNLPKVDNFFLNDSLSLFDFQLQESLHNWFLSSSSNGKYWYIFQLSSFSKPSKVVGLLMQEVLLLQ